jgi:hypothetical protein
MADVETNVVIGADTDELKSGMASAASAVEQATQAMRGQLEGLGAAARQAQAQITAACAQIGSTIAALQGRVASVAGSLDLGGAANGGAEAAATRAAPKTGRSGSTSSGGGSDDRAQVWRAELEAQLVEEQAFFRDSKAEELSFWQDKLSLVEAGSKARLAVERNIYELEKQLAVQNERDALATLDADERVTDASYARKKAAIEAQAELGRTSSKDEIAQLQGLLDAKWALDQDYFEKKLAAAADDVRMRQKLLDEERLAYEKFLTEQQKLETQAALSSQHAWQSLMQPIQRAFDTSISGMIMGTTTLQKVVANIAQSIIAEFVSAGVKLVTNWIAAELGMTAATEAGAAARSAAAGEGLAAGLAMKALNALKSIIADSAETFAGVFAFLSPVMGPAAAGPATAAAATVSAAAGSIASAAGGWVVPSDQLALVHQNEMILPADLSQGLRGMIAGGGAGGGVVVNVSAIDAASFKNFVMSRSDVFAAAIAKASRGFNPAFAVGRS